ncbi:MAG: PqqD family protein [Thermoanaerobaculaceae bacterium]|nr:PqqD family protein [Thermoanaerobaculaceae bacterium]MDI9620516.1 PqqD family protein [Acidobacteriota bacterium]NLH11275.1 PqqD family protein [Holophagae bacterium]HPW55245.1 PqqD family protein [Thermoanaerobaculaceae bacterium]
MSLAASTRWRVVDGEGVVLCQDHGTILGVNAVGARVLHLLATPRRVSELVDGVCAAFPDACRTRVATDIEAFLGELLVLGVITEATEALPGGEAG